MPVVAEYMVKKKGVAFVVLGHTKDFEEAVYLLQLYQLERNIQLPAEITLSVVGQYKYQGMTVLKFSIDQTENLDLSTFQELEKEDFKLLKPKA